MMKMKKTNYKKKLKNKIYCHIHSIYLYKTKMTDNTKFEIIDNLDLFQNLQKNINNYKKIIIDADKIYNSLVEYNMIDFVVNHFLQYIDSEKKYVVCADNKPTISKEKFISFLVNNKHYLSDFHYLILYSEFDYDFINEYNIFLKNMMIKININMLFKQIYDSYYKNKMLHNPNKYIIQFLKDLYNETYEMSKENKHLTFPNIIKDNDVIRWNMTIDKETFQINIDILTNHFFGLDENYFLKRNNFHAFVDSIYNYNSDITTNDCQKICNIIKLTKQNIKKIVDDTNAKFDRDCMLYAILIVILFVIFVVIVFLIKIEF